MICPTCDGAGDIPVDEKNPYHRTTCPTCHGSGEVPDEPEPEPEPDDE